MWVASARTGACPHGRSGRCPAAPPAHALLLVGPGVNDDALARRPGQARVALRRQPGSLPQEEAFAALDEADAGLILFQDTASHRHVDPNKIYEYLSLALPFIATDFPAWRATLRRCPVGLFVPAGATVTDMAAAMVAISSPTGPRWPGPEGGRGLRLADVLLAERWGTAAAGAVRTRDAGLNPECQLAQTTLSAWVGLAVVLPFFGFAWRRRRRSLTPSIPCPPRGYRPRVLVGHLTRTRWRMPACGQTLPVARRCTTWVVGLR